MNRLKSILQRIAGDHTLATLLVLLVLFAVFVGWQLKRLDAGFPGMDHSKNVATEIGGDSSIDDIMASLEKTPTSRPSLAPQRWQAANGARVYFVPAPELPMLDLRVVFDGGAARDNGNAGLARFTSAMIGEGTPTRSSDAIAAGFEDVGAEFSTASYRDMAIAEMRSLTQEAMLNPAVDLFVDAVAHPSFPRDAVERIRSQMLVGLARDEEEPGTIASRAFMASLYLTHPYASPPEGTVASVRAMRVEDMHAFHQRYYVAANAVISITGALDRAHAEALANRISVALPAGEPAPALPEPPVANGGQFHVKFASSQTHILIGLPALRRGDADEAALALGNEVLGGDGLTSMLGEAIRNQRGLAYSAGSGIQGMRSPGPFIVSLQTRNESASEALTVAVNTLKKFLANGPAPAQLEDARRQIVGSFPLQFAGNGAIVGDIGVLGFYHLPDDYFSQQLARTEKTSKEDIRAAFAKHVPVQQLLIVTVGPEKPEILAAMPASPPAIAPSSAPAPAPSSAPAPTP